MATPIKIIPTLRGEPARRFIERAEEMEKNPKRIQIYSESEMKAYYNMLKESGMPFGIPDESLKETMAPCIDDTAFEEALQKARCRIDKKENYTVDEAIDVVMEGVRDVYRLKDAI